MAISNWQYDVIVAGYLLSIDRESIRVKGWGGGTILNINVKEQFPGVAYSKEEVDDMRNSLPADSRVATELIPMQENKINKNGERVGRVFPARVHFLPQVNCDLGIDAFTDVSMVLKMLPKIPLRLLNTQPRNY